MRLLITAADMPSPQGRFYQWLEVLKITKQNGQDFFDPACLMTDAEEIRLLQPVVLEEYE